MMKALQKTKQAVSPQPSHEFCDSELGCYEEEYFHEMLSFERKRSERSGRPFLVMTMDFTAIRKAQARREAVKDVMKVLLVFTRTTDIKGWYRSAAIVGVLFTEMNSLETDTLQSKISDCLLGSLTPQQLEDIQISFHRFPEDGKPSAPGGPRNFTFYPDLPKRDVSRKNDLRIKRVMDVAGSIVAIFIFSPFLVLIPILIKLTSRGPVLFRQQRVGQYEKKFMFLKFRSMYVGSSDEVHKQYVQNLIAKKVSGEGGNGNGKKVYKITNDRRVTPIGNILRKTSMDELPQFFNVLKGEMSLVGPRPPISYETEKYDTWHRRRLLEVKPGITGLWQVKGRSSTTFDEMVRLDLQYATNWSLWMDIGILLKTPFAVVAGKGAY